MRCFFKYKKGRERENENSRFRKNKTQIGTTLSSGISPLVRILFIPSSRSITHLLKATTTDRHLGGNTANLGSKATQSLRHNIPKPCR